MSDDTTRIIDRVRKMLALANDAGATEGERENAIRMAHKILAKHNLSMAQVEASGKTEEKRGVHRAIFFGRPWARACCTSIAELFFCKYVIAEGSMRHAVRVGHYFIGKESNAVTAAEISKFVVESILKESRKKARELGQPGSFARSFATGAAVSIVNRCVQIMNSSLDEKPETSTGKEIVLASVYAQEKEKNQAFTDSIMSTTKVAQRSKRVGDGYDEGIEYGKTVPLNRQVEEQPPEKIR